MKEYHKIKSIFKRYEKGHKHAFKFIEGEYSLPEFDYLKDNLWVGTEKVDGTNIRIIWDNETEIISYKGKTDNAQIPPFLLKKLNEITGKTLFKKIFPDAPVCLYGEGYGARIQKGGGNYKSDGVDFVLFDIKIENFWLKREDIVDVAHKLNLDFVPITFEGTLEKATNKIKIGLKSRWNENILAEGMVLIPKIQLFNRQGHRIITKVKHKDFI